MKRITQVKKYRYQGESIPKVIEDIFDKAVIVKDYLVNLWGYKADLTRYWFIFVRSARLWCSVVRVLVPCLWTQMS